jgi:hypothetical protein
VRSPFGEALTDRQVAHRRAMLEFARARASGSTGGRDRSRS